METDRILERHWIATLRRKDSGAEYRIPIDGEKLVSAALVADVQAGQRFCEVIKIEVLE